MQRVPEACDRATIPTRGAVGASLLVFLGASAVGCNTVEIPDAPPPGIELGNEVALMHAATDKVAALMTHDGRVHLLAVTHAGTAMHVVVSERGVEETNPVGSDRHGYSENLAIADDGAGRVHVALEHEHWIWDERGWRRVGSNRCALLARAGDAIACATEVSGKELATPAQWGITAFGGGPAGIVVPYRTRPAKIVVGEATGAGWSYHRVLDYHLPYSVNLHNVGNAVLSGDGSGRLQLLFEAYEDNRFSYRHATLAPAAQAAPDVEWRPVDGQPIGLVDSQSDPVRSGDWFIPASPPLPFAVDPQTGVALLFARKRSFGSWVDASVEIRGDALGVPAPFPIPRSRPMRLSPAGGDAFHALVGVGRSLVYAIYRSGRWSTPIKIGAFGSPSLFSIDDASVQIASNGSGSALAIWPRREGVLVGRWIRLGNEETANPAR